MSEAVSQKQVDVQMQWGEDPPEGRDCKVSGLR